MKITELQVGEVNKIANINQLSSPALLSSLCIYSKKDYSRNVQCLQAIDKKSERYQFYVSAVPVRNVLDRVVFVRESPKILLLRGDAQNLVLQQKINGQLSDYLIFNDMKQSPYLNEAEARNIIMDITNSTEDFLAQQLEYTCFSPKNIVQIQGKWYLSTVGLLFGVDENIPEYTNCEISDFQNRIVFSWGCLLFKMVFGFPPFQQQKKPKSFTAKNYVQDLQNQGESLLKIYYYSYRILQISPTCLNLLEQSLSGEMKISDWKSHEYFTHPFRHNVQLTEKSREAKMINTVDISKYSLIMAAIEHKKKFPFQKLNSKSFEEISPCEVIKQCNKNNLLKYLKFAPNFEKSKLQAQTQSSSLISPALTCDYFYQKDFNPELDYPCRQLIKFIELQKQQHPQIYKNSAKQNELKVYAYPYAVAFELCKVQIEQPLSMRRKIRETVQLLLQLSSLNYNVNGHPLNVKPLHETISKYGQFSEMKVTYREHINQVYRYFCSQAMNKYNLKKDTVSIIERLRSKQKGLEYYRLSLKLLEASLIVRKGGRSLDLVRIETGERKQIEHDIEALLKSYFPSKGDIYSIQQ